MILVFGGTTEGRIVSRVLDESGKPYYYSTKGDLQEVDLVHGIRLTGAMTEGAMTAFVREHEVGLIIDAAHPFAALLHETIGAVSRSLSIPVIRYERSYPDKPKGIVECDSYAEMIALLEAQPCRRLLALTGVNTIKPLKPFWTKHESYFRIMDRDDSHDKSDAEGFPRDHLLYWRLGEEQNDAELIERLKPDAVVTKDSGNSGYFSEKLAPALAAGIPVYVLRRPALPEHYHTVYGPVGLRKAVEEHLPDFFPLKTGYTTGSTATAATTAAIIALTTGRRLQEVEITLPSGEVVTLPIDAIEAVEGGYRAMMRKRSGDDPDVTRGAEIWAEVVPNQLGQIRFLRGEGVGVVTLPGLGIPVGEPAINATPRRMMTEAIQRHSPEGGFDITISVVGGAELAEKTFNPRLGIVGGISIIGTSGVVKPFSLEAFVASIVRQVDVALALGADTIVINSGAKSERYLRGAYPDLPPQSFVQYGNFIGETLARLAECRVPRIVMGIMLGKAVKLAEGNLDTHSKKVVMNKPFLRRLADEEGCSPEAHRLIEGITLARELWEGLAPRDLELLMSRITNDCHRVSQTIVPESELSVLLIDDEGNIRYRSSEGV